MRSFLHGAVQLHVLHHAAERPIHGAWMSAELARHGYRITFAEDLIGDPFARMLLLAGALALTHSLR